jgi:hypothetical protein
MHASVQPLNPLPGGDFGASVIIVAIAHLALDGSTHQVFA